MREGRNATCVLFREYHMYQDKTIRAKQSSVLPLRDFAVFPTGLDVDVDVDADVDVDGKFLRLASSLEQRDAIDEVVHVLLACICSSGEHTHETQRV